MSERKGVCLCVCVWKSTFFSHCFEFRIVFIRWVQGCFVPGVFFCMGYLLGRYLVKCSSGFATICNPSSVPVLGWRWVRVLLRGAFSFFCFCFCAFPADIPIATWRLMLSMDISRGGRFGEVRTGCSRELTVLLVPWGPIGT